MPAKHEVDLCMKWIALGTSKMFILGVCISKKAIISSFPFTWPAFMRICLYEVHFWRRTRFLLQMLKRLKPSHSMEEDNGDDDDSMMRP